MINRTVFGRFVRLPLLLVITSVLIVLAWQWKQQPSIAAEAVNLPSTPTDARGGFQITPTGGINASTYNSGSFIVQNTSTTGQRLSRIQIDLRTALLPDLVFDPDGIAGDTTAKPFTPDSGTAETGLSGHTLSGFHNGANNQEGFDLLEVTFSNFDPGEQFTFSIDVDPTSIRGTSAPGPGESGSVSGLELTGSTVTAQFDDGASYVVQTFRSPAGSLSGSGNIVRSGPPAQPQISALNVPPAPAIVGQASQVIRVQGPAGAEVHLLVVEAALFQQAGGGYDIDPFEANSAITVAEPTAIIGANGTVDIPVTLTKSNPSGGLNYLVAVTRAGDGMTSPTSNRIVLQYDPSLVSLEARPAALDFGQVGVGTSSPPQTVTLQNPASSAGPVTVSSVNLSGPDAGQFSHNFTAPVTLAPGQTAPVQVTFTPASPGDKTASLVINHSGGNSPISVALTGQGAVPTAVELLQFQAQGSQDALLKLRRLLGLAGRR